MGKLKRNIIYYAVGESDPGNIYLLNGVYLLNSLIVSIFLSKHLPTQS